MRFKPILASLFLFLLLIAPPQAAQAQQHVRLDEIGLAFEVPEDWVETQYTRWLPQVAFYNTKSPDATHLLSIEYYGTLDAPSLAKVKDESVRTRLPAGARVESLPPEEVPAPFSTGTRISQTNCTAYVYAASVDHKGYILSFTGTGSQDGEATLRQILASLHFADIASSLQGNPTDSRNSRGEGRW